jgi:protein-disulfide isomerase
MRIKILIFLLLLTVVQANAMSDIEVKGYMKRYVEKKTNAQVLHVDIISSYPIEDAKGWSVYFLSMKVKVKLGDTYQEAIVPQTVFVKGDRITLKLMKKGKLKKDGTRRKAKNYAKLLKPKVPKDAYDDAHFLLGSKNAPHKIVFFSDPFCPYCKEKVIDIVNVVDNNPTIYGLYYYHLPLVKIHPASEMVSRAMLIFQKKGDIRNMLKLYRLLIEPEETDLNKILSAIEKKTGVKLTKEQLYAPEITEALKVDMLMKRRLQVTGTPTIFLDGKWDRLRKEFGKYAEN